MSCEICTLDASVDPALWTCSGCPRKFHAACIGVTVQRSSLRRKDKHVADFHSFILPCCESCQELVQGKLEMKHLQAQQKLLTEQLHANTEVLYKLSLRQENPNLVHEAIEGMEILLTSVKNELSAINKNSSLAGSVVAIKNHITGLLDTAISATKENMFSALKSMTSDISTNLRNINNELSQLSQLSIDTAASCTMSSNAMLGLDILDELKLLSANVMANKTTTSPTPAEYPSLEAELNNKINNLSVLADTVTPAKQSIETQPRAQPVKNRENNAHYSGWRRLGTRMIWKADWTEYDDRKSVRLNQQKQAAKARQRKKRNAARRNKTADQNSRHLCNHQKSSSTRYNNNIDESHGGPNFLPPDKVLLAAAKERFSKPPTHAASSAYRPIQFQRGEILNPYPADVVPPRPPYDRQTNWQTPSPGCSSFSAATCETCQATHSCFQRHRRAP